MNEEYKNERKRFINKAVIISIIVVFSAIVIGAMTLVAMSLIKNTKTSNGEDISKYMTRIEDAIKMVKSKYIDDIDTEKLVDGAVAGIAEATGDPYTRYMDEEEYSQMLNSGTETYGGLGIHITYDTKSEGIIILGIMPDAPALDADLKIGDVILSVDGTVVSQKSFYECVDKLKGEAGSEVKLIIKRDNDTLEKTVKREEIIPNNVEASFGDLRYEITNVSVSNDSITFEGWAFIHRTNNYDVVEYNGNKMPSFWLQEGERLSEFQEKYSQQYIFRESRDAADYIYLQSDLANLSGKKYHSKRNHINAFSKKHNWHYEEITQNNIENVRLCAEKWYKENADKEDSFLLCEKKGIGTMLDNMERLSLKGGAIIVDSNVVAFTLGSAINDTVFDIHIEKALKDFAEAYTVINREFAASLSDYKYINREDDMGLEGLRKAKLSYKPEIILKKYFAKVK